jgi:hypothetical protein
MGLWGWLFGYTVHPTVPSVRAAVQRNQLRFSENTAAALAKLIAGPMSEDVYALVEELARGGPYYRMARDRLFTSGDPRAIKRLIRQIERNDMDADDAARYLSHPANHGAVKELERLATTSTSYQVVSLAVEALSGMDRPEADDALRRIDRLPRRKLHVDTVPDGTGEGCVAEYCSSGKIHLPRWKFYYAGKPDGA